MELTLKHKLDSGNFADVWLGTDELGRRIAIKIFRQDDPFSNNALDHARALARVDHSNVVRIYGFETIAHPDSGQEVQCIAMEYIDGVRLDELIEAGLEPKIAKQIGAGIIAGLEQIHAARLAHRDLHPGNILVRDGTAKIIDILYLASLASLSTETVQQAMYRDTRSLRDLLLSLLEAAKCDTTGMLGLAASGARVGLSELVRAFRDAPLIAESRPRATGVASDLFAEVIAAIRNQAYDRRLRAREFLDDALAGVLARAPENPADFGELVQALDANLDPVRQLHKLARVCAVLGDFDVISETIPFSSFDSPSTIGCREDRGTVSRP